MSRQSLKQCVHPGLIGAPEQWMRATCPAVGCVECCLLADGGRGLLHMQQPDLLQPIS